MQIAHFDKETNKHNLRSSNIELLRIVTMLMIVAHHFAYHGGFEFATNTISINRLWVQFIQLGGRVGVNVFVLISGYFLVSRETIQTNRIIKLWGQIFGYSIVLFALFVLTGLTPFSLKELIKCVLPVTFDQWWYASSYFVLYLISPFLNSLLKSIDRNQYKAYLIVLLLCWCIVPTFTRQTFQSNNFLWLVTIYSVAGYLRLHGNEVKTKGSKIVGLAGICYALTFLTAVIFDLLGTRISFFGTHATFFYDMQSMPVLVISVLMFLGFLKNDIGYNKIINFVSPAMFGVYLIHENSYVRPFLWKRLFNISSWADISMLIPYSILVILCVFVGCTIIELVRINLIEKNIMPVIDKVSAGFDKAKMKLRRMVEKI